jgi:hypothetical protein
VYSYRLRGVQRWKTVDSYDEARRGKLAAEVDVARGEMRDLSRVSFGNYAREWVVNDQGRTSTGFRESTRASYRRMLEARIIPYFDTRVRLRLAEIEPRDVKPRRDAVGDAPYVPPHLCVGRSGLRLVHDLQSKVLAPAARATGGPIRRTSAPLRQFNKRWASARRAPGRAPRPAATCRLPSARSS